MGYVEMEMPTVAFIRIPAVSGREWSERGDGSVPGRIVTQAWRPDVGSQNLCLKSTGVGTGGELQ